MAVSIDISEAEIRNAIAVALAESFSHDRRDGLLRDIIRSHLQHKEREYDKETLLSKEVGMAIRTMAGEELGRVLESMKPEVQQIVSEMLGEQFKQSVYDQLRAALGHVVISGVGISATLDRDE